MQCLLVRNAVSRNAVGSIDGFATRASIRSPELFVHALEIESAREHPGRVPFRHVVLELVRFLAEVHGRVELFGGNDQSGFETGANVEGFADVVGGLGDGEGEHGGCKAGAVGEEDDALSDLVRKNMKLETGRILVCPSRILPKPQTRSR
jgi:hypothetical protein